MYLTRWLGVVVATGSQGLSCDANEYIGIYDTYYPRVHFQRYHRQLRQEVCIWGRYASSHVSTTNWTLYIYHSNMYLYVARQDLVFVWEYQIICVISFCYTSIKDPKCLFTIALIMINNK